MRWHPALLIAFLTGLIAAGHISTNIYAPSMSAMVGYFDTDAGGVQMTFMMLVYLMIGGVASLAGPLLGTLLVTGLMQALQAFAQYQMMALGPILVVVIIFFPTGLAGLAKRLLERWTR